MINIKNLTPEQLRERAIEYFRSIDRLNFEQVKQTPYSQKGFAKHLGLNYRQWLMLKANNPHDGVDNMGGCLRSILQKIEVHQLEGAMIGVFKPGILNKWFEKQGL